jgi:SAM-dependent methyltransferase
MTPNPETVKQIDYVGEELRLFELADNWKRYVAARINPFVSGDMLEVGAGLGANVQYYYRDDLTRFVSLEPDDRLCQDYRRRQTAGEIPARCELVHGTLDTLPEDDRFDSIIYIDVLEHIEDDRGEFERAYARLRPNGKLAILCPAHNFLFSPFDRAIGHFRRYNKTMFRGLSAHRPVRLEYLDCVGMAASIANKMLLRQSYPTAGQIRLWDRVFVSMSRILDPVVVRSVGKSVLGVWSK